jgi:hypothetical protein
MMTGSIGVALAAGLTSAVLFLSLAKGFAAGMFLSYLAPLPLMAAGLSRGTMATLVAGLVALAAVALVAGEISSLPFLVTAVAPSLVVVRQALLWRTLSDGSVEWYPPGLLLGWLAGLGLGLMLIGLGVVAMQASEQVLGVGDARGIEAWIAGMIGRSIDALAPMLTADSRKAAMDWWAPLFPAMVTGSWLVMALANAAAAQGILTRLGRNQRPRPSYGKLELPLWLGLALVPALAVGGLVEGDLGYVARNLAAVLLVPFGLLGLAGLHGWAARRPNARVHLAALYGVLLLMSAWVFIPLAGLGLVRFVTRFRRPPEGLGGKEE